MEPGTLIDDRYEILCALGVGGFGTVYKARQTQFDRIVALKTVNTTLLQQSDGPARFEREAQAMNALKHKNIVSLYGYGVWQQAPYMVVEYIEGVSLHDIMEKGVPLDPKRALIIIKQVFEALQSAHACGVVHRDLKPSNVMLLPAVDGNPECVKIIDFGLAKLMPSYGIPGQKLTETGYALGTCHFMPPEQALGIPVDQCADIYSAGCVFYNMLTGKLPFDADNNVAIMMQHCNVYAEPVKNAIQNHPLARPISTFVENCMAKDPKDRYQNCTEALEQIGSIMSGNPAAVQALSTSHSPKRAPLSFKMAHVAIVAVAALALILLVPRLTEKKQTADELVCANPRSLMEEPQPYDPVRKKLLEQVLALHAVDHSLSSETEFRVLARLLSLYSSPRQSPKNIDAIADRCLALANLRSRSSNEKWELAKDLHRIGRNSDAIKVASMIDAVEYPYLNDWANQLIAEIYIEEGKYKEAADIARPYSEGSFASMITILAGVNYLTGHLQEAKALYSKVLTLNMSDSDQGDATLGLARIAIENKRYEDAIRLVDGITDKKDFGPESHSALDLSVLRLAGQIGAGQVDNADKTLKSMEQTQHWSYLVQPAPLLERDLDMLASISKLRDDRQFSERIGTLLKQLRTIAPSTVALRSIKPAEPATYEWVVRGGGK